MEQTGQWRWAKPPRRSRNKAGINTDGADSSEKDIEGPIQSITHKKGNFLNRLHYDVTCIFH